MASTISPGPHARRPELKALTGLRAVAAIAVVVSHMGVPKSTPDRLANIAHWGYIGVPLFFMLSGVVLGYNYPQLSLRQGRRTIKFYIARGARILPLYWAMIAYCWFFYYSIRHVQYPKALVENIFAVQTWGPDLLAAQSRYNGPGWSIGVELFFYLLFPAVVPVIAQVARRWRERGLVLIIVACSVITMGLWIWFAASGRAALPAADGASAHRWLYRNPLCQVPIFVTGISIAFLLPYARRWSNLTQHAIQTALVVYVLGLAMFRGTGPWWGSGSYGAFFILPFALLLISLSSDRGWLARFLGTRPMVSLGVASFALYLTHRWLVWQLSTYDPIMKGHGLAPYAGFFLTLAILLLIGEGAHRYVEEPARKWIVKWAGSLARRFPGRKARPLAQRPPVTNSQPAPVTDRGPATVQA
jgi:peptidoglycan/LPS O-acetylase OafA/YrhL